MAKDKRYLVMVSYSVEVDAEEQIDASVKAAFLVKYGTKDVKALTVRVVREIHQASQEKALAEAPYADQVTVNEGPRVGEFLRQVVAEPEIESRPADVADFLTPPELPQRAIADLAVEIPF